MRRSCVTSSTIFCVLAIAIPVLAQTEATSRDNDQINQLLSKLSDKSALPSECLDPTLDERRHAKELDHFRTANYELSLVPQGPVAISGNAATLPVRVKFRADNGEALDTNSVARFIKRDGRWYFQSFDFIAWPAALITVLIAGILAGVGYASIVLTLFVKLMNQGQLRASAIRIFVPLSWPTLLRKLRNTSGS